MAQTDEFNVYVSVVGDPTDADDQEVPGVYLVQVKTKVAVDLAALTPGNADEIAFEVKESFHEHIGIGCLEDFTVSLRLPSGTGIDELDSDETDGVLMPKAEFCGSLSYPDVPREVRQALKEAARAAARREEAPRS